MILKKNFNPWIGGFKKIQTNSPYDRENQQSEILENILGQDETRFRGDLNKPFSPHEGAALSKESCE